jgi:hypothetical protein
MRHLQEEKVHIDAKHAVALGITLRLVGEM